MGYYLNPKNCKIIAFLASFGGFGLLFYLLLGPRYPKLWGLGFKGL